MPSKTDIWMPLYIGDYLADTSHLDAERSGAYLHLLMHYWRKGPLINDFRSLGGISKLRGENTNQTLKVILDEFFTLEEDDRWHQKRTDAERAKWAAKREVKSDSGKTGATVKWGTSEQAKMNRSERLANARRLARHSAADWQALLWVCGNVCVKCGSGDDIVKDHIVPIYQNGSDGIENIQPMCRTCNAAKGPESVDYRQSDWLKCLTERLAKPLVNASPLPLPLTSTEPLKTKRQKPSAEDKPPVDSRFAEFKSLFFQYYEFRNKVKAPWDGREGKALQTWLAANSTITVEQWATILRNRVKSSIGHGKRLSAWIELSTNWLNGIADEWGKPVNGGNKSNGRVENNQSNIADLLSEVRGSSTETRGNDLFPSGGGEQGILPDDGGTVIEGEL